MWCSNQFADLLKFRQGLNHRMLVAIRSYSYTETYLICLKLLIGSQQTLQPQTGCLPGRRCQRSVKFAEALWRCSFADSFPSGSFIACSKFAVLGYPYRSRISPRYLHRNPFQAKDYISMYGPFQKQGICSFRFRIVPASRSSIGLWDGGLEFRV